jgi:hypothetical protein
MAFEKEPNPSCFNRQLKEIVKKFSKSEKYINKAIDGLVDSIYSSDVIPKLNGTRKLRLPLPEYKISKRKGLRIIFIVSGGKLLPVAIYYKGHMNDESDIIEMIKSNLKEILANR